jgi:hypothetical protein
LIEVGVWGNAMNVLLFGEERIQLVIVDAPGHGVFDRPEILIVF